MNKLTELEAAVDALPTQDKRMLVQFLLSRLQDEAVEASELPLADRSVLDIEPVSLGRLLQPWGGGGDLLNEMLEGHR